MNIFYRPNLFERHVLQVGFGNKGWCLDKWTINFTQLRYDDKIIEMQMHDMHDFYGIIGDPHHDYIVFMVLSASLAMSELW